MNTPLNNDIQRKARELAERITVAHDIDPEIQEELYGHIEDKMRAYCSGEESVSQEDALILAREHFGDGAALRGLLHGVHFEAVEMSFLRRVLVLALLTTCAIVLTRILTVTLMQTIHPFGGDRPPIVQMLLRSLILGGYLSGGPTLLVLLLHHWKRQFNKGESPWLCHLSNPFLATMSVLALATGEALSRLLLPNAAGRFNTIFLDSWWLDGNIHLLGSAVYCVVWMWWVNPNLGRLRYNFSVGLLWAVYQNLCALVPASLAFAALSFPATAYVPPWLIDVAMTRIDAGKLPELVGRYVVVVAVSAILLQWLCGLWRRHGERPPISRDVTFVRRV